MGTARAVPYTSEDEKWTSRPMRPARAISQTVVVIWTFLSTTLLGSTRLAGKGMTARWKQKSNSWRLQGRRRGRIVAQIQTVKNQSGKCPARVSDIRLPAERQIVRNHQLPHAGGDQGIRDMATDETCAACQ